VRAKIADGGMAAVFVARRLASPAPGPHSTNRDEVVAIKMIRDDFAKNEEFVTMFMDEAKIVRRLQHPNIVRYYELGTDSGHVFLAMELLFGQSLWNVWEACRARKVRLRYDMVAWIGARAADGLHHAHELYDEHGQALEIVHRDVNATNLFVTYDGRIKVIDFGLAKAANRASKTAAGIIKGKVAYMSPEQAIGATVDRRTDIFALGTTLWELCCDRRLFKQADEVETLRSVHAAEVPDPTALVNDFPPALWRVLQRALARSKDRRYPTAAEMARDLDAFVASAGTGVNESTVADVMTALFAEERSRQAVWFADASGPDRRNVPREPLKTRSTFWSEPEAAGDVRPSSSDEPSRPPAPVARGSRRAVVPIAIAALVIVAAISAIAYALR
jgi:serine/threonine-protein kinase